ncbi:uncharacterized protein ARMOST_07504 [Armillaria ostoyae]|uniref:Uncharacterized protein n=1 Tax=Armillaria ostoyae TaxID=47428 RepID=A0A284R605_ARMOS|nr:uncharacterized protein ARMOST_07504 [Armillaria ostoyae]
MHIDVLAPDPNFSVTAISDARYMEYLVGTGTIPDVVSVPDSDVCIVGIPTLGRLTSDISPLQLSVTVPSSIYDGDYGYIRSLDCVAAGDPTPSTRTLPWDILECLIVRSCSSTHTSKHVALACKAFVWIAQENLFNIIVVKAGRELHVWMELLSIYPHLISFVAVIEVVGDVLYPIELQQLVRYITSHHEIQTVSIRIIDFVDRQHQIFHSIVASAAEINIAGCCYTDHDIVSLMAAASQMTSLVIGRDDRCFYDGLSNTSVLAPLKTAQCALDHIYYRQERGSKVPLIASPAFLQVIFRHAPVLRVLNLFVWFDSLDDTLGLLNMAAPSLEKLEIFLLHGVSICHSLSMFPTTSTVDHKSQRRRRLQLDLFSVLKHLTLGEDNYHVDFFIALISTLPLVTALSHLVLEIGVMDNNFVWDAWGRLRDIFIHLLSRSSICIMVKFFIWEMAWLPTDQEPSLFVWSATDFFASMPHVDIVVATPLETLDYIKFRVG